MAQSLHISGSHSVFVQGLPLAASKKSVQVPGGQNLKQKCKNNVMVL